LQSSLYILYALPKNITDNLSLQLVGISDQCVSADSEWSAIEHGGVLAAGFMTHCRKSVEGFGDGFLPDVL